MPVQPTPNGTRGTEMPGGKLLQKVFGPLARRHIGAYRRSGGTDRMSRMMKFPVVLVTTKGAKSGAQRIAALGAFQDGDDAWLIAASKGGSKTNPAWFNNMVEHPNDIWLEVGKRKMKVNGESLTGSSREEALRRIAAVAPQYGGYQEKTDRIIPIVRLTRVSG